MPSIVICVSSTQEAGGEEIARAVALGLGYRFVDEEIILRAARTAQVDPAVVAAAERKQPFLTRVFEAIVSATAIGGSVAVMSGMIADTDAFTAAQAGQSEDLRMLIRAAIVEVARNGNAVIGAHAASLALGAQPGVLRVLVTAPEEVRAERLAEARMLTAAEAVKLVAESDAGRENYMRTFYNVTQEQPTLYDIVFNTAMLSKAEVIGLVLAAAKG
jgi:cytidylate kinase